METETLNFTSKTSSDNDENSNTTDSSQNSNLQDGYDKDNIGNNSNPSDESVPPKRNAPPLYYLKYEEAQLLDFLSLHNITSQGPMHLPHQLLLSLIKLKKEIIEWEELLSIICTLLFPTEDAIIVALRTLEHHRILVLRHTSSFDRLKPAYVRLCDPGSLTYYSELLTDMFLKSSEDPSKINTFSSELKKRKIKVPSHMTEPFTHTTDFQYNPTPDLYNIKIFTIRLHYDTFYFTNLCTPYMLDILAFSMTNLIQFSSNELFAQLERSTSVSRYNLKISIANADMDIILEYAKKVYHTMSELSKDVHIKKYHEFIDYMLIFYHILPMYISYRDEKRVSQKNIETYTKTIMQRVEEEKAFPKFQFESYVVNTIKEVYPDANRTELHEQKMDFIKQRIIHPKEVDNLNIDLLVDLQTYYIFARAIRTVLLTQYTKIRNDVYTYLQKELQLYLRGKIHHKNSIFFNPSKTDIGIKQYLFKHYPIYYNISKHHKLIWIALNSKIDENMETDDINQKKLLSYFFNIKTKYMYRWVEILNINLRNLYLDAAGSLSLFQKTSMYLKRTNIKFTEQLKEYDPRKTNSSML